jgi:hypothetical protein
VHHSILAHPTSATGQKPRPSQPRHVSFHRLRTLVRASIRWSTALLSHGVGRCHPTPDRLSAAFLRAHHGECVVSKIGQGERNQGHELAQMSQGDRAHHLFPYHPCPRALARRIRGSILFQCGPRRAAASQATVRQRSHGSVLPPRMIKQRARRTRRALKLMEAAPLSEGPFSFLCQSQRHCL